MTHRPENFETAPSGTMDALIRLTAAIDDTIGLWPLPATVIADASFDHRKGVGGYAAWVRVDGVKGPIKVQGSIARGLAKTSTEAEVIAAVHGAAAAVAAGATFVLVQSDCMAVVHMNHLIWRDFAGGHLSVTFDARHVPGHTNGSDPRTWVNNWCDLWAKRCMREARDGRKGRAA